MKKARKDNRGSIYFIGDGMGHVKIGQTRGFIENRLYELQTGNAFSLEVLKRITTPIYELNRYERLFHYLFDEKRITTTKQSEWFNDSDYIIDLVKKLTCRDIHCYISDLGYPKDEDTKKLWLMELEWKSDRVQKNVENRRKYVAKRLAYMYEKGEKTNG